MKPARLLDHGVFFLAVFQSGFPLQARLVWTPYAYTWPSDKHAKGLLPPTMIDTKGSICALKTILDAFLDKAEVPAVDPPGKKLNFSFLWIAFFANVSLTPSPKTMLKCSFLGGCPSQPA